MGLLGDIFGSRPSVPKWNDISLTGAKGAQQTAIGANLEALPGAEQLATETTSFNQQQLQDMLNKMLPGWSGNVAQAQKNISSELKGEIPTDVAQAIQSSTAAQSLTGGFGGSGMAGNLLARNLGLTSLNLMQTGESSLESWSGLIDQIFAPGTYNVSSMFITPQQEFEDTMQNQQAHFQRDWMAAQVAATPDPITTGLINLGTSFFKGVVGGLSAFTGGAGGASAAGAAAAI